MSSTAGGEQCAEAAHTDAGAQAPQVNTDKHRNTYFLQQQTFGKTEHNQVPFSLNGTAPIRNLNRNMMKTDPII